jgi:hypothetical protein
MESLAYTSPITSERQRLDIEAVREDGLSRVAEFLAEWRGSDVENKIQVPESLDPARIERQLIWRLVQNPARCAASDLGYLVRNDDGNIVGTILVFPGRFLLGDRCLTGLCSSCFFVKPGARLQALLIFKKYLALPRYDFYFGTTCSAYSGKLWQKLQGWAVPNSEFEYILPFRIASLLDALADSKGMHRSWRILARAIGHGTDVLRSALGRPRSDLKVERTEDWDHIAHISCQHRNSAVLTSERTANYLEWRYERSPSETPRDVFCFRDKTGNEGWFAIGGVARGKRGQIHGSLMMDFVLPQGKISFRELLSVVVEHSAENCDALFLNGRPGIEYGNLGQVAIRRKLEGPRCFILGSKEAVTLLPNIVDFVPADGDNAD